MITLITGAPGTGKTAALVQLLQELSKDRAVFVNGIPDLTVPHVGLDDPLKWPELVPDGAVIVIDEVQRVWRPAGSGQRVHDSIAQLETHRHRGLDLFIVTQHPSLVHSNVRRLVGRHIHLRDLGILGRKWYEWPEATDPSAYRTAPHQRRYTLPKKVLGQYKSASLHVKPNREIPRALVVAVVCGVLGLGLAARIYASISDKVKTPAGASITSAPGPTQAPPSPGHLQGQALTGRAAPPTATATPESPASAPQVAGCIDFRGRCKCIDRAGFPVIVEWELCKTSAASFAGLVPLEVTAHDERPRATPRPVETEPQPPQPAPLLGFGAGEMRDRITQKNPIL